MEADTFPRKFSLQDIEGILPHRGSALIIHAAEITSRTQATGYFVIEHDNRQVRDHFGIFPGVLIAEFVHLTGAVLVLADMPESIAVLNSTSVKFSDSATIGDGLTCKVELNLKNRREFGFTGFVYKHTSITPIAHVSFTGTLVSKRVFERTQHASVPARRAASVPQPVQPAA